MLKRVSKKFVDSIDFGVNQNSGAVTTFNYGKWVDQPMTQNSSSLHAAIDGLTLSKDQFGTDFQMAMEVARDEFVNSGSLNNPQPQTRSCIIHQWTPDATFVDTNNKFVPN